MSMFDEYVEHSVPAASQGLPTSSSFAPLQYQGFEADGLTPDPGVVDASDTIQEPLFQLGEVQCTIPSPLICLAVSSDQLAMGLSNQVLLIDLSHPTIVHTVNLRREMNLYKLFMDPSGRHIIATTLQGENWYIFRPTAKARQLKSWKMVIESIAWNKSALLASAKPTSTREMLVGARNGIIYEAVLDAEEDFFKSSERYLQSIFSIPEKQPITGLQFDFFTSAGQRKALVVVTTSSRIYQFIGGVERKSDEIGRVFTSLFTNYRDVAPRILELPGNIQYSELHYYTPDAGQAHSMPESLAWLTSPGIYHGYLNFDSSSDDFIDGADVLPYPPSSSQWTTPLSIVLTEFHYVLLYGDRIVAVCQLDDKITFEDSFQPKNQKAIGLAADPVRKTYWVYTDKAIYELLVGNESRDVWKIYLEKHRFEDALKHARQPSQKYQVLVAQANSFFDEGRYFQAAQCYAQCSRYSYCNLSFEEIVLKFLDAGERDALRAYLTARLELTRKTDITQRMMLSTWLLEFFLSKCNELDDAVASESVAHDVENLLAERTMLETDLRHFLAAYKNNLDPKTVYELIQGHGRMDMYIHFATILGHFNRVIEHWIEVEDWAQAIDVINGQPSLDLYYHYGPILMRNASKETVDSWLKRPALDPLKLVPSLLQTQYSPSDTFSITQAIRFLNWLIFDQRNASSTIHNLLITFYIHPSIDSSVSNIDSDSAMLLRFLSSAPTDPLTNRPYYDLDYALRLCKQAGKMQACVHIYSKMGLWENSVDLALEKGDLELAKINADMPEDDTQLRKKLWLKIARYVVQDKKDIRTAMQFLESTDLLKIEDILPVFPDFVVIDDFKEEIARALEEYSNHIEALKKEMDEATQTAEAIKQDIALLKNRFITISATEQCSVCSQPLFSRQFYVFPCRHSFHADCLIGLVKEYMPAHSLRRIVALQNELFKNTSTPNVPSPAVVTVPPRQPQNQRLLLSAGFGLGPLANPLQTGTRAAGMVGRGLWTAGDKLKDLIIPDALAAAVSTPGWIPGIGGGRKVGIDAAEAEKAEKLRNELEDILASSCPLCESVVAGLDRPFVLEGEVDTTWTL